MIDKEYGKHRLVCDICNNELDERFDSLEEVVDAKLTLGFKSKKECGGWIDICPTCLEW